MFSTTPADVIVNETEAFMVECSHPSATEITWWREGDSIDSTTPGLRVVTTNTTQSFLSTSSALPLHSGNYSCSAALPGGEERASFSIRVQCKSLSATTTTTSGSQTLPT